MDTLFSLKVFRQVVQNGSFTRAADQLGISTAMASKHVSHLENTVQAKLLHRNSRNLHLTEAGEAYFRQCSYALDTLDTAARIAASGTDKPQGVLRIAMPQWFANPRVSGWLTEYCRQYPDVSLDLQLSNRHVDLIAEGVDLALRVSNDPNPALIVKPLADIEFYLLASPDYLKRHGTPNTPEEMSHHLAVLPSYTDMSNIEIQHSDGHTETLSLNTYVRCDSTLMTGQLIREGIGIGYQPAWCTEKDIHAGKLVKLLPDYKIHRSRLYAVYVDRTFLSAKVRSMIDFLSEKTAL
ncbi:LysR family transcriptional regulator [Neisseria dumasiana]|uniref:LysR family transcriptional regulator n=1 Tax=Neisseria dumasiana TaxID=1931275 RepID=A0ABX3WLQ8_9NEIS|nr:LysR family transcriptional regulator [Neisseria dumasiana]OSI35363.1 LysR family transcriptional regulator [Neisseria dumasiana]UOO85037.1 LysR family transcriptional regulator [Neisseria dumasiana]